MLIAECSVNVTVMSWIGLVIVISWKDLSTPVNVFLPGNSQKPREQAKTCLPDDSVVLAYLAASLNKITQKSM